MVAIQIGDIVTRRSHNQDVLFKIVKLYPNGYAKLKGLYFRLEADAPLNDLIKVNPAATDGLAKARERLISARKEALARKSYPSSLKSWFRSTVSFHITHRT